MPVGSRGDAETRRYASPVIPADAGISFPWTRQKESGIPAFAGMTGEGNSAHRPSASLRLCVNHILDNAF